MDEVQAQIDAAKAELAQHRDRWNQAAQVGHFGRCEVLEQAIVECERHLLRLSVRNEFLQSQQVAEAA